jgi:hypothetical protein
MTMMVPSDPNNGGSQPLDAQWRQERETANTSLFTASKANSHETKWKKYQRDHQVPYKDRGQPLKIQRQEILALNNTRKPRKRTTASSYRHCATILYLLLYALTLTMDTDASMSDARERVSGLPLSQSWVLRKRETMVNRARRPNKLASSNQIKMRRLCPRRLTGISRTRSSKPCRKQC